MAKSSFTCLRNFMLMTTASAAVTILAGPAFAQTSPENPAAVDGASSTSASTPDITVTGTRIVSRGFSQPTPTTVVTAQDLERTAQPNVFDAIAQLPSLQGSNGRATRVNSTSSGQQGLSSFNLRGVGEIRTLTLLDGQRVTPANFSGVPDISQFPQLLIERVDIVTGGASASYGSDAVGGVVNFITNKHFVGVKGNLEGGITTYGDDENVTAQLAVGRAFLNDRLHVVASAEYGYEAGVPSGGFGVTGGANGRTWYQSPAFLTRDQAATTDGKPQLIFVTQAQQYQYTKYGLITNGPLQGTAFGVNGVPFQFNYGSGGQPLGDGSVSGCFSPFCVGGDLSGNVGQSTSLAGRLERMVGYSRVGFDIDDRNEIYFTVNLARVKSQNNPNAGAEKTGLTIQCDNAFLPAAITTACAANNITQFEFGSSNGQFPNPIRVNTDRRQQRYVIGMDGAFDLFGSEFKYNGYGAHGVNDIKVDVHDISLKGRYDAAIDAIAGPGGTIVCRDPVARAAGCVPLNVFGQVAINPAALAYVVPLNGPRQRSHQTQDVASINFSLEPFSSWAGPVAIAFGGEYRHEQYKTVADPYGAGVTADSPNSAEYPVDPTMNTSVGNNWYAGNYHNGEGKYHVKEAYLEINFPFLKSSTLGEANINVAGRRTDYSTSGAVNAWKVGGVWKTPLDGLRFRAVTSRDVRAPNLSELFAAPIVTNSTVLCAATATFQCTGVSTGQQTAITVQRRITGNTALSPEIARNTEIGVVLDNPSWFRGFSASFDYYTLQVNGAITGLDIQTIVDLCRSGAAAQCAKVSLNNPNPNDNFVEVTAFNASSFKTRGFDIEASYRTSLEKIGIPGTLTLRGLATHVISFFNGSEETAGNNGVIVGGTTPKWKGLLQQSWDTDTFSLSFAERFISDGKNSNEWIECQTDCPVSTDAHPTVNNNRVPGYIYLDIGGGYKFSQNATVYFKVDNVFNKNPAPAAQQDVGYGANPYLYDVLGRMYRAGVRVKF